MKKNPVYLALRRLWVGYKLLNKQNSYLRTTGFLKSHEHIQPIDQQGQPIPWMNYAIIELLNERLQDDLVLFEYGAGFSTRWFASRVKEVHSVEYDRSWEDKVRESLEGTANAHLHFIEVGPDYISAARKLEQSFDLVLVDGRERVACAINATEALSSKGVLLLDDSDRMEYAEVFPEMEKRGFKNLRISGLKPFSFTREETTIFYRERNCLGL